MTAVTAGTTIVTIDWAVRGTLTPGAVETLLDDAIEQLVERSADLVDLDDESQGLGVQADVVNYRRELT